jgi:hypothetical protein
MVGVSLWLQHESRRLQEEFDKNNLPAHACSNPVLLEVFIVLRTVVVRVVGVLV